MALCDKVSVRSSFHGAPGYSEESLHSVPVYVGNLSRVGGPEDRPRNFVKVWRVARGELGLVERLGERLVPSERVVVGPFAHVAPLGVLTFAALVEVLFEVSDILLLLIHVDFLPWLHLRPRRRGSGHFLRPLRPRLALGLLTCFTNPCRLVPQRFILFQLRQLAYRFLDGLIVSLSGNLRLECFVRFGGEVIEDVGQCVWLWQLAETLPSLCFSPLVESLFVLRVGLAAFWVFADLRTDPRTLVDIWGAIVIVVLNSFRVHVHVLARPFILGCVLICLRLR